MNKNDIIDLIKKFQTEYYDASPTSELALHPFKVLLREIYKYE